MKKVTSILLLVVLNACAGAPSQLTTAANGDAQSPEQQSLTDSNGPTNLCAGLFGTMALGFAFDIISALGGDPNSEDAIHLPGIIGVDSGYGIDYLTLPLAGAGGTLFSPEVSPPASLWGGPPRATFPISNQEIVYLNGSPAGAPTQALFNVMTNATETTAGNVTTRQSPNGRLTCTKTLGEDGLVDYECTASQAFTAGATTTTCAM